MANAPFHKSFNIIIKCDVEEKNKNKRVLDNGKKNIATIFWTSLNVDTNQKIDIRQKEQRNFAIKLWFYISLSLQPSVVDLR